MGVDQIENPIAETNCLLLLALYNFVNTLAELFDRVIYCLKFFTALLIHNIVCKIMKPWLRD